MEWFNRAYHTQDSIVLEEQQYEDNLELCTKLPVNIAIIATSTVQIAILLVSYVCICIWLQ